jgi:glycosyltransferase involved in cell wall biosynthesis
MAGAGTPLGTDLLDALLGAGYAINVLAPAPEEGEWAWFPPHDRLRVHRYRAPSPRLGGFAGRLLAWLSRTTRVTTRALRVARAHGQPSVVYAFSSLTIPAAVLSGLLLRRPTIGSLFGTFLFPVLGRKRALVAHFEEVVAFKSPLDRLVILNDGTRGNDVARALRVPDARVRFWMHGLDVDACTEALKSDGRGDLGLPAAVPLVVSASRLVAWKRVDRILRAAPEVLMSRPETVFAFTGDGPERPALEALAHDLSISHAVRFLGSLPREANLRLIAASDVFCALYDYSCVGVALLEALGCGVAVVVADTGATSDFVENEVNGLVITPGNDHAAAAAILSLVSDSALRARLGGEARRRAQTQFLTPERRRLLELEMIAELAPRDATVKARAAFP